MISPQVINAIRSALEQPEVQTDIALVEGWILEAIRQKYGSVTGLISCLGRLILIKIKGVFRMPEETTVNQETTQETAQTATQEQPMKWTDTRTQMELEVLSAGINAMANHESWATTRDKLVPTIVNLLFNYGVNWAANKINHK